MIPRLLLALIVLGGSTAFAPAPFPRPGKTSVKGDLASLQGVWTVTRSRPGLKGGYSVATQKVKIDGTKWTFLRDGASGRVSSLHYEITVDTKHNPPHIDITRTLRSGTISAASMRGIFRVKGNKVEILYVTGVTRVLDTGLGGEQVIRTLSTRPKGFDSPPSRAILLTLTRDR